MLARWIAKLGLALTLFATPALAQPAPVSAELTIRADQPGPEINRNIYGQFAEHLGRGIYEGIYVGTNSRIPNTRGFRNDVIAALRELDVPLVRWPGGCFADWYHWRDGIGPRNRRPVGVNTNWGNVEEPNSFGTHEFFDFIELIGAEAYVNFNMGTGTPREMTEWVEYMTSPSNSTLAQERRRNGRDEPFRLPYITIGNETWGCGGNMRPEFYADMYAWYATFLSMPEGNRATRIASGPHGDNPEYTEALMSHPTALGLLDGVSLHHYTLPTGSWTGAKGAATGFPEDEWASTMFRTMRMDEIIRTNVAIMDRYDPEKRVGLYIDEWGTWYDVEPGSSGSALYQQNTLRDAVVAAANLNIFHSHADRVRMTNIAQMVNVLQAMILTDGPRMLRTPTYHVFHMYRPFQGATSLPIQLETPQYRRGEFSVPAVSASAARGADGKIYVALANLDPNRASRISTRLQGVNGSRVSGQILTADAMDTHNTFDAPDTLVPAAFTGAALSGDRLVVDLPAKAVVVLTIE